MFYIAIISFLLAMKCPIILTIGVESPELTTGRECYYMDSNQGQRCSNKDEQSHVEFKVRNVSSDGMVSVELELPPISCHEVHLNITLLSKISIPNNTLCGINNVGIRHSLKNFRRIRCENGSCSNLCGKFAKFSFHHVTTGSYQLQLQSSKHEGYKKYISAWQNITTNFTGTWKTDVLMEENLLDEQRQILGFRINFTRPTSTVDIVLMYENHTHAKILQAHSSNIEDLKGGECKFGLEMESLQYYGKIKSASCTFHNMTEKLYILQVTCNNEDQCDDSSRFHPLHAHCVCVNSAEYFIKAGEENVVAVENGILFVIIKVALVLLAIGMFTVGLPFWLLLRKGQPIPDKDENMDIPLLKNGTEILLLYTRDCPQFMKVMETFKLLLENEFNLKVYDCFDTSCTDVLNGPEEWFQMLMNRPMLKTVIVMSKCAYIQDEIYKSHNNFGTCVVYRMPDFLDNFFIYSLRHVKQDFSNNVYRKIYTVQLNGFSGEMDLKIFPTSYAMYTIPGHLGKLLADMNLISQTSLQQEMKKIEGHTTYAAFLTHLEILRDYEKNNGNYLEEILNISMA